MSSQAHTPSRSSFPLVLGIIGLFLLFWFLTSEIYLDDDAAPAPAAAKDRPSLAEFRAKEDRLLADTSVVDAANGKVRLNIERAKELVVTERSE